MLTREEIIKRVNENDANWFENIYYGDSSVKRDEYKVVYNQSYGDGNDWFLTLYFEKYNLYVSLEGTYSSWDSSTWDSVSFSVPYEHTEIRYKNTTLEDIRDEKIDSVINKD
jgi:hypothetical protein